MRQRNDYGKQTIVLFAEKSLSHKVKKFFSEGLTTITSTQLISAFFVFPVIEFPYLSFMLVAFALLDVGGFVF